MYIVSRQLHNDIKALHEAITQLFRLSSSTYTLPNYDPPSTPTATYSTSSQPIIADSALPSVVTALLLQVQQQSAQIVALGTSIDQERHRYHELGKPIGGTFLILGLTFILLGWAAFTHY